MNEEQIKHMVNKFLSWKLPEDFNPDAGIGFDRSKVFGMYPIGTNLLDATQATEMVKHMIKDLPTPYKYKMK